MEINQFWSTYNIKSPDKDKDFVQKIWQVNTVFKTKNWYTQFFESLGKEGTTKLLSDVNESNFRVYKDFLGKRRHMDIGSGTGLTSLLIHEKSRLPVEMIDVHDGDITDNVKSAIGKDFRFTLYHSGESLPFEDGTFDSASFFYVLHHCETRDVSLKLLKEVYRVLQNGSFLIVIDEPVSSPEDRERLNNLDAIINSYYASSGFENGTGFDVANFYTKDELEKQFVNAGFTIYKCRNDLEWSWILPRSLYILKK
jgi:ubiquinone/menaquinone biosynthesis C-methylase UbiE